MRQIDQAFSERLSQACGADQVQRCKPLFPRGPAVYRALAIRSPISSIAGHEWMASFGAQFGSMNDRYVSDG